MYTNDPITEGALLTKYDDLQEKAVHFAIAILNLELEIKKLKDDIKEVKNDAKLDGVAVSLVCKTLNEMKKIKRISEKEKNDLKVFFDVLSSDENIISIVDELTGNRL